MEEFKTWGPLFQSTLLQEERQLFNKWLEENYGISIHAPTRGATPWLLKDFYNIMISIHAPTRGATVEKDFYNKTMEISIHAPTRGATL